MKYRTDLHNPSPEYLRSIIKPSGLSMDRVAELLGISTSTLRNYLSPDSVKSATRITYPMQYALEAICEQYKSKRIAIV